MTAFDFAVLGVIGVSVLLGLWRGVTGELLALAAWVVGFFAAREYGRSAGALLFSRWISDPAISVAAGFVAVFAGVLILFALGRYIAKLLLRAVGLGVLDRLLGGVFGVARGALVVVAGVMVGGFTALPKQSWWQGAMLAPPLETAVVAAKPWLPPEMAKRIRYR